MQAGYVLLTCDFTLEYFVLDKLRKIPEVTEAQVVCGPYDIIARIQSQSIAKLKDTIKWQLMVIDLIKSTMTLIRIADQGEE